MPYDHLLMRRFDEDALAGFVSVWMLPASIVAVPIGLATHLDVMGWVASFVGVFLAFAIHDTMREVHNYEGDPEED